MTQETEKRAVLVFENRNAPGMRVATELEKSAPSGSFHVLKTSDLLVARQALKTHAVAAIIIEVGREAGDALGALRLLGTGNPVIPLYVYNGFMLPRIAEKSREYGVTQYFENHKNFGRFIALILEGLKNKRRGIIHGITLVNFLQLMNNEKFSGRIRVSSGSRTGALDLQQGQLLHADLNGDDSNLALAEMSCWEKVTVEIEEKSSASGDLGFPPGTGAGNGTGNLPFPADPEPRSRMINILQINRSGKKYSIHIGKLAAAISEIHDLLGEELLRMDIFLAADGRSLAGWNSHPLACSSFAGITTCLQDSLKTSRFPPLGKYYLIDLDSDHLIINVTVTELQWGMLLKNGRKQLGFLLNIVVPNALRALENALSENSAG